MAFRTDRAGGHGWPRTHMSRSPGQWAVVVNTIPAAVRGPVWLTRVDLDVPVQPNRNSTRNVGLR